MKQNCLILALLLFASTFHAQRALEIYDVYTLPAHPMEGDSIYVVTEVMMPAGSQTIYAEWIFTDSLLTVMECYHPTDRQVNELKVDTLMLGVWPKGDYALEFISYQTESEFDCNPSDSLKTSILFDVGRPFDLEPEEYSSTIVLPNPTRDGMITLTHAENIKKVDVFAPTGQLIQTVKGKRQYKLPINLLTEPYREYRLRIRMRDKSIIYRRVTRLF